MEEKIYEINERYRDLANPNEDEDEFCRWINKPLDSGIANSGGIRNICRQPNNKIEFLVFVSNSSGRSIAENPWQDQIDLEAGRIKYWGDAKASADREYDEFMGNSWIKRVYRDYYAKNKRDEAPPVLVFEKTESGYVEFRGLCIIEDLKIERFKQGGDIVGNYLVELTVLNTDKIKLEWIHDRVKNNTDRKAPEVWKKWVSEGIVDEYHVWLDKVREASDQKPEGKNRELIEGMRTEFEDKQPGTRLEYLVKELLSNLKGFKNVEVTPTSGDRGVDIRGNIELFNELEMPDIDPKIKFKAQVKNKNLESGIPGKDVSRLASRIKAGEIGLFITTTYFTGPAQEETYSSYPVKLIPGKELSKMLAWSSLTSDFELEEEVIERVKSRSE